METTVTKATRKRSIPVPWTSGQDELLRRIWAGGERVRQHMDGFGRHTWAAVICRACTLGLGKRTAGPKGQTSSVPSLILKLLSRRKADRFEIARELRIHEATAHAHLLRMKKNRQVYVAGWRRRAKSNLLVPLFAAGRGKNVPRPERAPNAVRMRQSRARARAARLAKGDVVKRFNPFSTLVRQVVE